MIGGYSQFLLTPTVKTDTPRKSRPPAVVFLRVFRIGEFDHVKMPRTVFLREQWAGLQRALAAPNIAKG
jgi:hypothetical protein